MTDSKNKKKPNSKSMIEFDAEKNCIEFKCDHEDTKFKGSRRPYFKPDKVGGFILKESKDYDKAFLFLFECYEKDGDNINYLNVDNEKKSFSINTYINHEK